MGGLHPGECLHLRGGSTSKGVCIWGGSLHQGGLVYIKGVLLRGEGGASRGVYIRRLGRPPLSDATGYSQ